MLPDHRARRNSVQPWLGWCPVVRPSGGRAQRWNGNSCLLCSGAPLFLKLSDLRGLNHVRLRRASSPSTPQDLSHLKEFQRTLFILMLGYNSRSLSRWEVCTVVRDLFVVVVVVGLNLQRLFWLGCNPNIQV